LDARRFSGEAVAYGLGNGLEAFAALAVMPFLGRYLAPAELGVADVITATAGLIIIFVALMGDHALARYYYDEEGADRRRLAFTHLCLLLGTGSTAIVLSALFIAHFSGPHFVIVDKLIASLGMLVHRADAIADRIIQFSLPEKIAWIFALLHAPLRVVLEHLGSLLRLRHEPGRHLVLMSVMIAVTAVLTISMLVSGAGVRSIFFARFAGVTIALFTVIWYVRRLYAFPPRMGMLRRALRFQAPLVPAVLAYWIMLQSPRYIIGVLSSSASEIGFYGVGVRFSYIVSLLSITAQMVWLPYAMGIKDREEAPAILGQGLLYFVAINVVIIAPFSYFSIEAVQLLLGPRYLPGAVTVPVMMMAAVMAGLLAVQFAQLSIAEKPRWFLYAYIFGSLTLIVLGFLLVPELGSLGASLASLAGYAVTATIVYLSAQHFFRVSVPPFRFAALIALWLAAGITAFMLTIHRPTLGPLWILRSVLTLGTWGCAALILGPEHLTRLVGFVQRAISGRNA
jgi:O-antigen/teichoic acid export membrane protein